MKRRRSRRDPDQPLVDIVAEAEAFLNGTYARYMESSNGNVPCWAWLNGIAHGSEDELVTLAGGCSRRVQSAGGRTTWSQMVSFLAADLLTLARAKGQSVARLQHDVLVPLELDLAREGRQRRLGPADVVSITLAALHGHPSSRP